MKTYICTSTAPLATKPDRVVAKSGGLVWGTHPPIRGTFDDMVALQMKDLVSALPQHQ